MAPLARPRLLAISLCLAVLLLTSCAGESKEETGPGSSPGPIIEDPGPVHVHGLGINPGDGALFTATHTDLFRTARRSREAKRVAGRYQDTMAFTIIGPDRFLGSGHPDGRERLPPFLGLIESRDAGLTWRPRSLQGKMDFHMLEARAGRVLAAGEQGLHISPDGGRTWNALGGRSGLLEWPQGAQPHLLSRDGAVQVGDDNFRWQAVGDVGGRPSAFASGRRGELLAALHDGTIKRSTDGGRRWDVRSRPLHAPFEIGH